MKQSLELATLHLFPFTLHLFLGKNEAYAPKPIDKSTVYYYYYCWVNENNVYVMKVTATGHQCNTSVTPTSCKQQPLFYSHYTLQVNSLF